MSEISRILEALAAAPGEPAVLATLVGVKGSSYRRPGARLLVFGNGSRVGSISGGCLEDDVCLHAQAVLQSGVARLAHYDTTQENDLVWGVGLGCEGVVHVLIERIEVLRPRWLAVVAENLTVRQATELAVIYEGRPNGQLGTRLKDGSRSDRGFHETIRPPPALVIFGAGDDARPLLRMAKEVGWHVSVVDSRPAYATAARFAGADAIVVVPSEQVAQRLDFDAQTFAVVMTHRYREDLKLLRFLLGRPLAYLGVLGPRKRTERLLAELGEEGVVASAGVLERLCAPVGLDLGGTTPESIALSILAEMQCCLSQRSPIRLRDRAGPIYG